MHVLTAGHGGIIEVREAIDDFTIRTLQNGQVVSRAREFTNHKRTSVSSITREKKTHCIYTQNMTYYK